MPSWKRTFWAVYAANLVTAVGMLSFLPFFPSYLLELGVEDPAARTAWTGVIFGAAPLVAAFSSPLWGSLGDRVGRKAMVLRAMLAIALFVGLMGLVRNPWELLALRVLQGTFSGFIPPSITLVSISAPADRQGSVAGTLQSALAVGAIVGPFLGATVGQEFGKRWVFGVVSVLALCSALCVLVLAREDQTQRQHASPSGSALDALRGTFRDLARLRENPRLVRAVVLLFWVQFGVGATNPLLELFVEELPALAPERRSFIVASLFSLLALMNVIAMPAWGRFGDRRGHGRTLRLCSAFSALGLVAHAVVPTVGWLFPARALLGLGSSGASPSAFGVAAHEIPVERRGGAFGAVFSARALATSLSAMVGGLLAGLVGIRGLFALSAVLLTLVTFLQGRGRRGQPCEQPCEQPCGKPGDNHNP